MSPGGNQRNCTGLGRTEPEKLGERRQGGTGKNWPVPGTPPVFLLGFRQFLIGFRAISPEPLQLLLGFGFHTSQFPPGSVSVPREGGDVDEGGEADVVLRRQTPAMQKRKEKEEEESKKEEHLV
eukprot:gene16795-biopygen9792